MPFGLDPQLVERISGWQRRLMHEAKFDPYEPDVPTLLERLATVRDLIDRVVVALRDSSPAAGRAIVEATGTLRDLTGGDIGDSDLFAHLDTVGWAIEGRGSGEAYLEFEEELEERAWKGTPSTRN